MGRKVTTEGFTTKANKVHGDKYDYSKVKYINNQSKIIITCLDHGDFEQRPYHHLRGSGCPRCAKERNTKTKEQFVIDAREVHGDKYDYSKVEYVSALSEVVITCPEHGDFEQEANSHLRGRGCAACARESQSKRQRKTKEQFVIDAREVHGDKYDYSKVEYITSKTKVCIICTEHGEFWQDPNSHLRGHGCATCAYEVQSRRNTKTEEQFIVDAREVHGDKYDYSKVEYANSATKVTIVCPEHGEFLQTPNRHLGGCGCFTCARESQSKRQRKTTEQFIVDVREVHGDKYDYSKVQYTHAYSKVIITCPEHGDFLQTPHSHFSSASGCPKCAEGLVSEPIFRKVLEEITSLKFPKKRPKWLKNPDSGRPLELDCYNQKLKVAFELQGRQHYNPIKHWGGKEAFQKVLQRDQIKKTICEEKGIHLFCIDQRPARGRTPQEKEEYYKKEIKKCLQQLPQHVKIRMNRR